MPLMQDLFVGTSGLNVAQRSINVSAHNLSNVETDGFVRQQIVQGSSPYSNLGYTSVNTLQVGIGVDVSAVYQARNSFLDKEYRTESGREAFYTTQYEAVAEIEELFGELNGVAFQDNIEELWNSVQELAKDPTSLTTRATVIQSAQTFVERSENIYTMLKKYQTDLDTQVQTMVNRINEIGDSLVKLNDSICMYEANGMDLANDLRDTRNQLLDELGSMVKISYTENADSQVTVMVEGVPFVTESNYFKMDTVRSDDLLATQRAAQGLDPEDTESNTAISCLVPVWPAYGYAEVCDLSIVSSSELNTDIGGLRGLLVTRGVKAGNYTDIPIEPNPADYKDVNGVLDADAYQKAYSKYSDELIEYNKYVEPSVIVQVQAQFDKLINGIVTTINDILSPNKEVELADGSKVLILDEENAPVGMDKDSTMGEALFNRKSTTRYTTQEITLADGTTMTAKVYNQENSDDNYSLFTLGEIEVNTIIKENYSKLPLSVNGNTNDYDAEVCDKLLKAWQTATLTLTPESLSKDTFYDYYNEFIGALATKGEQLRTISENQKILTDNIDNQRLSVTGVSSDEELTNLIKYQHAYNASARYVNVINEMLETIIERL